MSEPLPKGNFRFLSQDEISDFDIMKTPTHGDTGYIVECDLRLGCAPRFITQSHPSANGLCERMVGTIKRSLSKVAMEHPKSWHKQLGYILWALREVSNE